jgi:hypothetical protein
MVPGTDLLNVPEMVAEVLHPRHFFVAPPASLDWEGPLREEVPWELFRGRLLDPAHTRQRHAFVSWNIFWADEAGRSAEPLLSVKLDTEGQQIHVVRALHCHAWEGYDAGGNVYLSRETTKWLPELVGTVPLGRVADAAGLRRELAALLCRAVVGASRLPLTSVESPLPAFALGRLAYFERPAGASGPARSWRDLVGDTPALPRTPAGEARLLETVLRAAPPAEVEEAGRALAGRWAVLGHPPREALRLLRTLFNEVALSPWTDLAGNALALVGALVRQAYLSPADELDLLSWLLRHLGRHLTAYDLVTFHHRGANYPDALLLDAALKRCLALADGDPALFETTATDPEAERAHKRLRRRALRQGWLLRRRYEGHPVPDVPTSPGEAVRVLPPPHARVPEEQILQLGKRRRRLFAGDPLERHLGGQARAVLEESVRDLAHSGELRELGRAVFIDRPLGVFKHPLEPDQTLLLSYEAFSRSVAEVRLADLGGRLGLVPDAADRDRYRQALAELHVAGLPLSAVQCEEGRIVSLADVRRAADDFVLLRTTRQGLADFAAQYDLTPLTGRFGLDFLTRDRDALIVPAPAAPGATERVLVVYDGLLRRRLELGLDREQGYEAGPGGEHLRGGLRVLKVWEPPEGGQAAREHDLRGQGMTLPPLAGGAPA